MNIQELEEIQYNWGRATEHQNAYALSSMERRLDDPKIAEELAKGRFVVVDEIEQFCPITDAILPSYQVFVSAWDDRESAEAEVARIMWEGRDIGVLPIPLPEPIPYSPPGDDVPF